MLIRNLSGLFTGNGFAQREGRWPTSEDCGYVPGPVDISIDSEAGTIRQIGPALGPSRSGEGVLNGEGLVALSGFIDSHTHAVFAGDRSAEFFTRWTGRSYSDIAADGGGIHSTTRATDDIGSVELEEALVARLRMMRTCGVTTVEVKSGYANSAAGEVRLLRVVQSAASAPGVPFVVPTFLGLHALPPGRSEHGFCDEMIGVLSEVAIHKLARFADSFPECGFFSPAEALRFSRAALAAGLGLKVHADELTDLGTSARFVCEGATSIDHLQHIAPTAIDVLRSAPTVATVLPATSFFLGLPYADARKLIDGGARVALATDFNPGTAPAADLQFTALLAAAQLRMSPAEILCGLTFNAAGAIGLDRTHGTLCPGHSADLNLFAIPDTTPRTPPADLLGRVFLHRLRPRTVLIRGRQEARASSD